MKKIKNLKEKEKAFMEETGVSQEEFKVFSHIAKQILKKRKKQKSY